MTSVLLGKSWYSQKLYWASRTVMLRTFGITQTKPAQCVTCSYTSTQMCTNLSHPPLAVDAKDTMPCSDDLLVSRKNRRKQAAKCLERFQGLFVECSTPHKTWNYEYTVFLWFHMHLLSLPLLQLILLSFLLPSYVVGFNSLQSTEFRKRLHSSASSPSWTGLVSLIKCG